MKKSAPERQPSATFGLGKFLLAVVLAVLFFWLGHSMVRHRFFQGGREHWNGSIGQ